jgi:tetratricopeptide (TPR) repeat protein
MSDTSLILTAKEKTTLHEYDAAEKLYRTYLEEKTADSDVWILLGDVLIAQQKYYEAIEAYGTAVDKDLKNPAYLAALGSAYAQIHQYADAKDLFEKAATLSGDFHYQYRVADMLGYMGKHDEALVIYSLLAIKYPDEAGLYKRMATVHTYLGHTDEVTWSTKKELELRKKAVNESPGAFTWFTYADALSRYGLWVEAKEAFLKALCFEENAETHLRIGEILTKLGESKEASAEFAKAAAFDELDFAFLLHLADHLTKFGLYEESIRYYTKALALRSVHADAWVGIAYDLLKLDQKEEAKAFFEMAKATTAVRELPWGDKLHKSEKTHALDAAFL